MTEGRVILHGLGRTAEEWTGWAAAGDLVPDLAELRRTDAAPDFDRAMAVVRAALDARGIDRATVIGHSGGGHLAVAIAEAWPERVARLIVIAAVPPKRALAALAMPVLVLDELACGGHDPHLDAPELLRARIDGWIAAL